MDNKIDNAVKTIVQTWSDEKPPIAWDTITIFGKTFVCEDDDWCTLEQAESMIAESVGIDTTSPYK